MLDAVNFELLGLPAVAILTNPFLATGLAMAELQGLVNYPFATVAHPVTSLLPDEAMAVADGITPTVEALLLGQSVDAAAAVPEGGDLQSVVEDLAVGLRSDGADLTATRAGDLVTFTLHIPTQACAECVMPSSMLRPIFQQRVDAQLGAGLTVEIEDPR